MALSKIKTNSIDDSAITNAKITNSTIDVTAKITGAVPIANGGSASTSASAARTALGVAVGSDVQAFDSDNALTDTQQTFSKAQIGSTYTAALATTSGVLDFDTYNNFILTLANGSNSLAEPTTEGSQVGQTGYMIFIQPSSGTAASLSLHGDYESPAAGGITLSTANNDYDVLGYVVKADNSILLGTPLLNFG
jgi:hypothetical protein|tara:strand:+ start:66 stop:647 length:582 start_codon:yes stop_codon:yes gene_type:complete